MPVAGRLQGAAQPLSAVITATCCHHCSWGANNRLRLQEAILNSPTPLFCTAIISHAPCECPPTRKLDVGTFLRAKQNPNRFRSWGFGI